LQNEAFKDTLLRLSKRTGIKGKNFEKIKFAVVPRSTLAKPEYLKEGEHFQARHEDLQILIHDQMTFFSTSLSPAKIHWGWTTSTSHEICLTEATL